MNYLVLRAQRRTLADLSGYTMHARRSGGDLRHVAPSRTHLNRVLVGSDQPGRDARALIDVIALENLEQEVEGLRKTRGKKAAAARLRKGPAEPWDAKNAKPWTEIVLSASPGWFRDEGQGPGEWNEDRVAAFAQRAEAVMQKRFGDDLVHLSLHLDEETPHVHALVLPTVEKVSKRRGRQRIVSHRQHAAFREPEPDPGNLLAPESSYERLQTEFADEFRDLGIERGESHALNGRASGQEPPEHRSTAEWQAEQGEALAGVREARQEAKAARRKAEQAAADARAAEDRAKALVFGVEALADGRVVYAPEDVKGGKEERLRYGPEAPKSKVERKTLSERIAPAYRDVLAVGRSMQQTVRRWLEPRVQILSSQKAALEEREREIARDAAIVETARRQAGRPPFPEVEEVRRRRQRGRDEGR